MTVASYITLTRIISILPVIYLTSFQDYIFNFFALSIFIFAGLTDYLDGYFARKNSQTTKLGALLDLLADKLLVCVVLVWMVFINQAVYLIIPVLLIISRELIISTLRQHIIEISGNYRIKVSCIGKSKTTIQFIAISLLIISPNFGYLINLISILSIWLAAGISIYSLYSYFKAWKAYLI